VDQQSIGLPAYKKQASTDEVSQAAKFWDNGTFMSSMHATVTETKLRKSQCQYQELRQITEKK